MRESLHFSQQCLMIPLQTRGGAVWQLVGLITRRSQVQILPPQPKSQKSYYSRPSLHLLQSGDGKSSINWFSNRTASSDVVVDLNSAHCYLITSCTRHMNTSEAKKVLEPPLFCAQEPLSINELKKLYVGHPDSPEEV